MPPRDKLRNRPATRAPWGFLAGALGMAVVGRLLAMSGLDAGDVLAGVAMAAAAALGAVALAFWAEANPDRVPDIDVRGNGRWLERLAGLWLIACSAGPLVG